MSEHLGPSEELFRPNTFFNPVLFSDGIGSAGKRMLGHILSSMGKVEKMSHHFVFDYVSHLHWLGKITNDAAVSYLRLEADLQSYQLLLSRDCNFRPGDTTSVFSNPRPFRYVLRLFRKEGDSVSERLMGEKPILHEAPHDGLRNAGLFFAAFGSRLRIIHILRHPVDLALDLIRRGFGYRVGSDPREFQFTLNRSGSPTLISLRDLGFDTGGFSPEDLVALTVSESLRQNLDGYQSLGLDDKARVSFVFFDDFCEDPFRVTDFLSGFLEEPETRATARAVRREGLPRSLPRRAQQRDKLLMGLRQEAREAFLSAERRYEVMARLFKLS